MDGFFGKFGFKENPFASTNADKEPRLSHYFVPPPYFASVRGDPSDPKSSIIFAPRGGGKTAQKVMLEEFAETQFKNPIIAISYDQFKAFNRSRFSSAGQDWHLGQIIQRLLVSIVFLIEEGHGTNLSVSQKRVLTFCFNRFLGELRKADAEQAFRSVKGPIEKTGDFLKKHGGTILSVASAIAAKWGFGDVDVKGIEKELRDEPLIYIFERLVEILRSFGFESVYILVDRVDEVSDLGTDAESSAKFINPLIRNLDLMESEGVAFKVFLWDRAEDFILGSGFRQDRIPVFRLDWTTAEIGEMISKRLKAYSDDAVDSLNDLLDPEVSLDLHLLVSHLSIGSPRDAIRLAQAIVDEHTRIEDKGVPLTFQSIEEGIRKFSRTRSIELYGNRTDEIVKIGTVSFTIGDLANDVFRIKQQAARNKIQNYMAIGAVKKTGEIENPGNRPLHEYSLLDPRLAFVALSSYGLTEFLDAVCFECPRCQKLLIREGPEVTCHACALEFNSMHARTLLDVCSGESSPKLL